MPALRVHLAGDWSDDLAIVRDHAVGCELIADPAQADVGVGGSPDLVDASPNVRAIVVPWAGPGEKLRARLRGHGGITLHNLHDNASATAEQAIALLMAACRLIPTMDAAMRRGEWPGRDGDAELLRRMIVLEGRSAVLLGYGEIGRRIGRALEAMDVRVTAVTRTGRDGTTPVDQLDDVLGEAELLVSSLPGTDATRGLMDARRIDLLPERSVVVNVGRGHVFDERPLFEAVKSRRVAAAGLDVWWKYPHQADAGETVTGGVMPWHELDNVVMMPHCGGAWAAEGRREIRAAALGDLLAALARGELPNHVDLDAGY